MQDVIICYPLGLGGKRVVKEGRGARRDMKRGGGGEEEEEEEE